MWSGLLQTMAHHRSGAEAAAIAAAWVTNYLLILQVADPQYALLLPLGPTSTAATRCAVSRVTANHKYLGRQQQRKLPLLLCFLCRSCGSCTTPKAGHGIGRNVPSGAVRCSLCSRTKIVRRQQDMQRRSVIKLLTPCQTSF